MHRRRFLLGTAAGMGALTLGPDFWRAAISQEVESGPGPYGALLSEPDPNGLLLPEGFTSRVIALGSEAVEGTDYTWPAFPDGGATFTSDGEGWLYAVNHEDPRPGEGGVSVVTFAPDGAITGAYSILDGTRMNCAGGPTPWDTWLSCEEFDDGPGDAGGVWECNPMEPGQGELRPALGRFEHEAVTVDPEGQRLYLTEDTSEGRFYRFTPDDYPDLSSGTLEAASVGDEGVLTWIEVPDPSAAETPTREQVPDATLFDGGEGCRYDGGVVYVATKGDDRIWAHHVDDDTMNVIYDAATAGDAPLRGVDNITIEAGSGDLYVAEDGDDMQLVVITSDREVAPVVQVANEPLPADPAASEIAGPAFSPDGTRLYFSSQRGGTGQRGITYEITGPFRGASNGAATSDPPTPAEDDGDFPVVPVAGGVAAAAVLAGAATWRFRSRGSPEPPS